MKGPCVLNGCLLEHAERRLESEEAEERAIRCIDKDGGPDQRQLEPTDQLVAQRRGASKCRLVHVGPCDLPRIGIPDRVVCALDSRLTARPG